MYDEVGIIETKLSLEIIIGLFFSIISTNNGASNIMKGAQKLIEWCLR